MKKTRSKPIKTQAVIYIRVSSKRQVENMSLGEQRRLCEEYCHKHNLDINDERIFEEKGESAKTAHRTELQRMLEFCTKNRKDIGFVVVYKIDRFSRKVEDHAALKAILKSLDIQILSASEPIGGGTNTDALMENILASFAPTGYINAKNELKQPTLKIIEDLRQPITRFFNEFSTGRYTQEEAVLLARKLGVRTNKGDVVSRNGVIKMLKAIVYTGNIQNASTDGKIVKGLHEPIIDYVTYQAVQDVLNGRKRTDGNGERCRVKNALYPLRRFLVCSLCSKGLTGSEGKGKTKAYKAYHCHRCTIKKDGARVSIPQHKAHELFEAQLSVAEPQDWVPSVFREIVLRRWNDEFKTAQKALTGIDNKLQELKQNKARLTDLLIERKISDDTYAEKETEYTITRAQLEAERSELKVKEENKERIVDNAAHFLINLPGAWREMSLDNQQKFQNALFMTKIVVHPDQTFGTPQFSPIIKQVTDMEVFFSRNKVDALNRTSTMAEEGRFELPLQVSPY